MGIVIIAATQYIRVFHVDIIYHITTVNCFRGVALVGHHRIPQCAPRTPSYPFTTISHVFVILLVFFPFFFFFF